MSALPEDDEKLLHDVRIAACGVRLTCREREQINALADAYETLSREIERVRAEYESAMRGAATKQLDAQIALNKLLKRARNRLPSGPEMDDAIAEAEAVLENINEESSLIEQRVRAETLEEAKGRLLAFADTDEFEDIFRRVSPFSRMYRETVEAAFVSLTTGSAGQDT